MSIPSTLETIIWRVHLRSDPQRVFDMLATDEGRAQYWTESAVESRGVIDFRFINGLATRSRIIECDPPRRFTLEYFGSNVEFTLEPDGKGGTDLTMINRGFAQEDRDDILPGWLNVLFPLKAAVDFGIDLRSHDAARTWSDGFIDQ